jgi:hypothetical protein
VSRASWIWVLLLLLVANAGAFWFVTLESGRMQSPQRQSGANLDTLVLVSELPPAKIAAMRRDLIEAADSAAAGLQLPLVAGEGLGADTAAAALTEDAEADLLQDIVVSATRLGEDDAAINALVPAADVSAAETAAIQTPQAPDPVLVETDEEPAKIPLCWEYGPLDDGQLQQVVAELNAPGLTLPHRSEEVVVSFDYWVYLAADSISKLQRLQLNLSARGVDSYVISGGPLDGSLSLGLFSLEASARNVAAPLREEGYPVEIYVRPRETLQRHWLMLPEAAWIELRESTIVTQLPDAAAQQTACPALEDPAA